MGEQNRKTGIDIVGDVPWGTHLCQFYQSREDLLDILVPYFKAGLENNEFCMWVVSEPLSEKEAKGAMRKTVPHFDLHLKRGQMEVIPHTEWYLKDGAFNLKRVLNAWVDKLNHALAKGYDGIRITGNTAWLEKRDRRDFADYEEEVNKAIGKCRMIAICPYPLDKCDASEIIDVVGNHQSALIRREGEWEIIESSEHKQAEEKVKRATEAWKLTFDSITDLVGILDKDFRFVRVNKAYSDVFKMEPREFIGRTCYEVVHGTKEPWPDCPVKKALESKKPTSAEFFEPRLGIPLEVSVSPIFNGNGEVDAVLHIAKDITERKKTEGKLKESEKRLSAFMNSSPDGFFLLDPELNYVNINDAGLLLFPAGTNKEDILGKNIVEIAPDIKETGGYNKYLEVLKTGKPFFIDDIIPHPKFGDVHLALRAFKVNDNLGVITTDITERKRAEEALRESEERFRALTESTSDWVWEVDENAAYTYASPKVRELLGYEPEEIIGKTPFDLMTPENAKQVAAEFGAIADAHKPFDRLENANLHKDGRTVVLETSGIPIFDADREFRGYRGIDRDITERKRAEEEKRKSEERFKKVIGNIFKFVPEGLLVFTDKLSLYKQNKAFQDIIKEYSAKLNYTEKELRRIIMERVKDKIINEDYTEIRIPRKHER